MKFRNIKKFIKDPFGIGLYYIFEKWRTKDGRRILSTNSYKKISKIVNLLKYRKYKTAREEFLFKFLARNQFEYPDDFMHEGWSLFDEAYFPHTSDVVLAAKEIYSKKGRDNKRKLMPYPIANFDELLKIEAFHKFAFSEKMIAHAAKYLGEYPILTNIGLVRSDPLKNNVWQGSQLLHQDVIDTKVFRVIVYISDVDIENGPFTFYPIPISLKIEQDKNLRYGAPLSTRDIPDHMLTDYTEAHCNSVTGPAGTVLTVDTCNCFHFGSRATSASRCILMLAYTSIALENLRERMGLDLIPEKNSNEPDYIKLVKDREFLPSDNDIIAH